MDHARESRPNGLIQKFRRTRQITKPFGILQYNRTQPVASNKGFTSRFNSYKNYFVFQFLAFTYIPGEFPEI